MNQTQLTKKTIALIFGGVSSEHEVSLNSARNIFKAMNTDLYNPVLLGISKTGTWFHVEPSELEKLQSLHDHSLHEKKIVTLARSQNKTYSFNFISQEKKELHGAFPIVHGTNGEDGVLQGYLKTLSLPFVGCSVMSSAIAMDKEVMKATMNYSKIPNTKFLIIKREDTPDFKYLSSTLGLPFFIKPANAGSSVGVHKIKSEADFKEKLADSFKYDHKILAEEFIQGREIECAVIGLNQNPKASLPGELIVHHEFYSYEAKYLDDKGADIIIPARLSPAETESIQKLAVKTYQALHCDGLTRVDFFLRENGELLVNEINTLPGFTKISMYPKMWEASGKNYQNLITELIELSFEKQNYDQKLDLNFRD